jgi:hypothetical protein
LLLGRAFLDEKRGVRVNYWLYFPLTSTYFLLSSTPRLLVTRLRHIGAESRNTLTSHWGGKRKYANVTLGWKAELGAERLLRKAESRAVDLPGPRRE